MKTSLSCRPLLQTHGNRGISIHLHHGSMSNLTLLHDKSMRKGFITHIVQLSSCSVCPHVQPKGPGFSLKFSSRNKETFSPILVLDDSVDNLFHLLGERRRVRREFLSRRTSTFLCLLHLIILVPATTATRAGCSWATIVVAVSLAFSGCLFVTHFLFNVLQVTLFYGLWCPGMICQYLICF